MTEHKDNLTTTTQEDWLIYKSFVISNDLLK